MSGNAPPVAARLPAKRAWTNIRTPQGTLMNLMTLTQAQTLMKIVTGPVTTVDARLGVSEVWGNIRTPQGTGNARLVIWDPRSGH